MMKRMIYRMVYGSVFFIGFSHVVSAMTTG
jgi:vesicle coat complex subunit